jgi:Acetylornithine deacetylase/Succinyl-diaminopimelate desuccinylase and related deacylases
VGYALDLTGDVVEVTAELVDIPSESHHEGQIADAVQSALAPCSHLSVDRSGNAIIAETRGRPIDVIIAGHLDTVPAAGNLPHRIDDERLYGLGSCDMKGGVTIALKLAHDVTAPRHGVRYIFYDCEEVAAVHNGLARLAQQHPHLLAADLAIVMEPSNGVIEGGCQGTIRAEIRTAGKRAHSARAWQAATRSTQRRRS